MSELDYIHWLSQQCKPHPQVQKGIGDDAAFLKIGPSTLVTTDMLMDGVDFLLNETDPIRIGKKALAVNLSDMAAMVGKPIAAFVSLALPRLLPVPCEPERQGISGDEASESLPKKLFEGIRYWADQYNVAIAGGDTNSWDGPLVINITLLGEAIPPGPIYRSGGKPGDWLFVTGPLGGSILGKHLDFTPRIREAEQLLRTVPIHAMIDISDGLSSDLHNLCEASHCGAILDACSIPISSSAYLLKDGKPPLHHALSDGEDFELLFAVPPVVGQQLLDTQPLSLPEDPKRGTLFHIGTLTEDLRIMIREGEQIRSLPRTGFEHRFGTQKEKP